MIYTVTFNPAIDYIVGVNNLKHGEVNRADEEQVLPGGKGINVSVVLNNLGIENTALGFIAGYTGDMIESMLHKFGLTTDFIKLREGMSRINVKIKSQMETEINGAGPEVSTDSIDELYSKLKSLKSGDFLVLSGSIPHTADNKAYMEIMEFLDGKGVKVAVDATGSLLFNVLKYKPFLVKPNMYELGELFEVTLRNKSDVEVYARKLKEQGAVNVLVSMAGDGALLIDENGEVHEIAAPMGRVINSVGAGDSMVAGFIAGYQETGSYDNALKKGVAAGSASAFSKNLATKEQVEELLKEL